MIGMRISIGTKSKDEAEKPFWISFADLMSSLMIMFLLVMSVTLVSITDEVSKKKQKGIDRINQIDEFWGKLAERFKNDPSIKLDKTRYAIDLGELALFPLGESVLTDMQVEKLRELTKDKILPEADSDIGKRWLKRVVVEGFTDPTGSYFYNLQLSLDRSLRLLCEILDPNDLSLSSLKETQQKRVRDRPFAGGVIAAMPWRWHAIISPLSPDGPLLVLRRLSFDEIGLDQFKFENFLPHDFLNWINKGISIIFYGATGSGKTTLLVAVLREFFINTRLGIAEALPEIPLTSNRWFRLVEVAKDTGGRGGVDFTRVVAEMMRLSPQRLVMGELRGEEAAMLLDFASTGHGGVMTTMHAGTIDDARTRFTRLARIPLSNLPPINGIRVWRDSAGIGHARMDQL